MDMDNDRRSVLVSVVGKVAALPAIHNRFKKSPKPHRAPDHIDWDPDCPGLGIRLRGSTGDGTWVVQWREGRRSRRRSLGAVHQLSRDDARTLALELMGHTAPAGAPRPPLLGEFIPTFLADCAGRWRPATRVSIAHICQRHLVSELGGRRIDEITRADVLMWFDVLRKSQNWALSVLSSLMIHAETLGHREPNTNPCSGLRRKKTGFKARYPDPDAYRRLGKALHLRPAEDQAAVQVIQFLALTGARRGEALALRWDYIQTDRIVLPDSKTGPKTIWMPVPVKALIDSVPRGDSPFVFGFADRARTLRQLNEVWAAVRVNVGGAKIRLHDLRHGYASVAVRQGAELKSIAGLLGHSDFATTMGYAHLRQEHIALAAERVSSRLSKALKPPPPPDPAPEVSGHRSSSKGYLRHLRALLGTEPDSVDPGPPSRKLTMEEEIELYYSTTLNADDGPESPREFCTRRNLEFTDFKTSLRLYRDHARSSLASRSSTAAGSEAQP